MIFGSLFSGIGGIDLGLNRAGWRCAWGCDIEPHPRSVFRRHWPGVPLHDDVQTLRGEACGAVDLVCGGFPCQDVSVAGARAGLAGERSGLFYEFVRVVAEVAPKWVLLENVPGLLSSNGGRDMGAVLGALGELGYGWTYRVLDSQYFGVAQRRRRVFIVGCTGGVCTPEVLLEPESVSGDPPPGRETGEDVARCVATGTNGARYDGESETFVAGTLVGRRGPGPEEACRNLLIVEGDSAASTPDLPRLRAGCGRGGETAFIEHNPAEEYQCGHCGDRFADPYATGVGTLAPAECPRCGEEEGVRVVAHTLRAEGHDASEDGAGRGTPLVADPLVAKEGATWSHEGRNNFRLRNVVGAIPRRLTPTECERLQGFPDGWTATGIDEQGREVELSDSARYRMLGNAVTVPVAEWIGRRILALAR